MNNNVLVSVIIPLYNREATIEMAINSVLEQTYKNLEIIVVDDCSTDKSVEVVQRIKDERIRVIVCDKNGGACVARNIGIENSKGEIIAFQDSDDCWHKDKLEKSLYYMGVSKADFVFSALCREEKKDGKIVREIIPRFNLNTTNDKLSRILYQNYVSTQTIVARKEVFAKIRFDNAFSRFQDWDLAINVIRNGYKVYYIEESLVESYVLNDSISYNGQKALKSIKLLEKKYMSEYKKNCIIYGKFCERAGYLIELSGYNGAEYFWKAYKAEKKIYILAKYVLAKLRLYWILNRRIGVILTKTRRERLK